MTRFGATTAVSLAGEPRPARQFNVIRGEYKVSNDENAVLSTVLGSCVACCMWDPMARVGGMNHFLVAGDQYGESEHTLSHGVYAMEVLINGLLKRGANRNCLKAKLFGGAAITRGLPDIGKQNSAFAIGFLEREAIECVKSSLGGVAARRVKFWPTTGRARVLNLPPTDHSEVDEPVEQPTAPTGNDVELF